MYEANPLPPPVRTNSHTRTHVLSFSLFFLWVCVCVCVCQWKVWQECCVGLADRLRLCGGEREFWGAQSGRCCRNPWEMFVLDPCPCLHTALPTVSHSPFHFSLLRFNLKVKKRGVKIHHLNAQWPKRARACCACVATEAAGVRLSSWGWRASSLI